MVETRTKGMRAGEKVCLDMASILVPLLQRLNIDRL